MTIRQHDENGNEQGIRAGHASDHLTAGADPISLATSSDDGLMSAEFVQILEALEEGNILETITNGESAVTILRGELYSIVGGPASAPTALLADKDDSTRRPANGRASENIAPGATGRGITAGRITGVNTSAFSANDQVSLGNNGGTIRPPPETDPFTGEVQHVGTVDVSDAANGIFSIKLGGLLPSRPFIEESTYLAPLPVIPIGGQTTKAVSTTLEGAVLYSPIRVNFNRLDLNVTSAPGGGATLAAAIYQQTNGKNDVASKVASFDSIDATTTGLKTLTPSEGLVSIEQGLFHFLLAKVSGTGTPSLSAFDIMAFDLLNTTTIPTSGYPLSYTTALSPSPLPATFDPKRVAGGGQATPSSADTAFQIILRKV